MAFFCPGLALNASDGSMSKTKPSQKCRHQTLKQNSEQFDSAIDFIYRTKPMIGMLCNGGYPWPSDLPGGLNSFLYLLPSSRHDQRLQSALIVSL
jgi:hypothetical protein